MGKILYDKKTGEGREYEGVDAREILAQSPDLYTDVDPKAGKKGKNDPDGDGVEGAPQNVANVENEFRREPVGDNPPAQERDEVIIRNPVTDVPRMAPAPGDDTVAGSGSPTVASAARAAADAPADPLDHDGDGKKGGSKAKK